MFTGIVEELGEVVALSLAPDAADARVTVRGEKVTADAALGDSIAVDGVCLTVVDLGSTDGADNADGAGTFTVELMHETLLRTTAGTWRAGTPVNLERSVTPATRLGGHLVQGHVDGVGTVTARTEHPGYDEVTIEIPAELGRFVAPKGAIAVDGISLTVIDVTDSAGGTTFTVGIIPATRSATTIGRRSVGDAVNIEVDVMAKYAARLLEQRPVPDRRTGLERPDARERRGVMA